MAGNFYAKSPGNEGYIKNMEVLAFHDLNGIYAFQTQIYRTGAGRYYLYCGSMKGNGMNILDITDPRKPALVNWLECVDGKKYPYMCTPKIQICDDLMCVALSGVIPMLHGTPPEQPYKSPGGLLIYSLREDPVHPKLLSHWKSGFEVDGEESGWVHRFCYNGGPHVHLSAMCPGFKGMIYRILDISDPTHPFEAGRWWNEGQEMHDQPSGQFQPSEKMEFVHCVYADEKDNKAYVSTTDLGFKIVDISDVSAPRTIGHLPMTPPFCGKLAGARSHTFLPLTGRNFAVGVHEGERWFCQNREKLRKSGAQPLNTIIMIDISNPADPTMVATFPYPEVPEDFPYPNFTDCGLGIQGPFGPHNVHEPMTNKPWIENNPNRVYDCYFHAGMRVYDVSDPYYIKEIAYFIPPNPEKPYYEVATPGPLLGTAEDCVVDDRGNIFMNCMHDGLYVLRVKEGI